MSSIDNLLKLSTRISSRLELVGFIFACSFLLAWRLSIGSSRRPNNSDIRVPLLLFGLFVPLAAMTTMLARVPDAAGMLVSAAPRKSSNSIPGGTGWLFGGYIQGQKFAEGPYYEVIRSRDALEGMLPRRGDSIRLLADMPVHIVDFRSRFTEHKLISPKSRDLDDERDVTGITLEHGTEVVVRDISRGSGPGSPLDAIWLRVALPLQ